MQNWTDKIEYIYIFNFIRSILHLYIYIYSILSVQFCICQFALEINWELRYCTRRKVYEPINYWEVYNPSLRLRCFLLQKLDVKIWTFDRFDAIDWKMVNVLSFQYISKDI